MKQKLKNKPDHYTYRDLMMCFQGGTPLSCEQLNFLSRHEKTLSSHGLDPVLKYYLKPYKKKAEQKEEEKKKHELISAASLGHRELALLKKRLDTMVKAPTDHVILSMTPEQFEELKTYSVPELILYHGNQFLTGAPHIIGGIPYTIFFQWGNLFGVAKYVIMAEEKALKSNLLIYVEDMQDRAINQCVKDYNKHQTLDKELERLEHRAHEEVHLHTNQHTNSPFKIPKLTLSVKTSKKDEDKD